MENLLISKKIPPSKSDFFYFLLHRNAEGLAAGFVVGAEVSAVVDEADFSGVADGDFECVGDPGFAVGGRGGGAGGEDVFKYN